MSLEAIIYKQGKLQILNQLLLPHESLYEDIESIQDGWEAIRKMKVRGAPAIAIVGCLSLAVELKNKDFKSSEFLQTFVEDSMNYLVTSRPTAVNLGKSAKYLIGLTKKNVTDQQSVESIKEDLLITIEKMLQEDIQDNKNLGEHGADHILKNLHSDKEGKCSILTHCNTGSLATAGYGTALGVIRSLSARNALNEVYCTETRPYNQGARLTAYELVYDGISSTLIADSMVALLMKSKQISAVVVGADRVTKNGDTANKIGTLQIAIVAKYYNVPFYVAAPSTCHCHESKSGDDVTIEQRPPHELTSINGIKIAAEGIKCWNPSFDITDHQLITGGIITENGVYSSEEFQKLKLHY